MGLFVIQLAKMTLVVLGIFFTPIITRKFIRELSLPVAQDMMKWGGLGMMGAKVMGAKAMAAASGFGQTVRSEIPSVTYRGSEVAGRVLGRLASHQIPWIKSGASKAQEMVQRLQNSVQERQVMNLARKEGLYIPTSLDKLKSRFSEEKAKDIQTAEAKLSRFQEDKKGVRDPFTGLRQSNSAPSDRILTSSAKMMMSIAQGAKDFIYSGREGAVDKSQSSPGVSGPTKPPIQVPSGFKPEGTSASSKQKMAKREGVNWSSDFVKRTRALSHRTLSSLKMGSKERKSR